MSRLLDFFSGADDTPQASLAELKLRQDPAMVLLFTDEVEDVALHFVNDPAVKSFVVCPGLGCPICHLGSAPERFALLPVYDAEARMVKVLRVAYTRRSGSLGLALIPHLADQAIANKVIFISRDSRDGWVSRVEARPLQEHADRGEEAIAAFLKARGEGLKLLSAFVSMPVADLADIPAIRRKLDLLGDWAPPQGTA